MSPAARPSRWSTSPKRPRTPTGVYSLGPAEATVVTPDVPGDDTNDSLDGDQAVTFGGTDTNTVVGPSTET